MQNALQAAVDRAGPGLRVGPMTSSPGSSPGRCHGAARVEADGRSASVVMLPGGGCGFVVDCWAHGIHRASGSTQELSEVAGAVRSWIQGAEPRELAARWPFLMVRAVAETREHGEEVAERWQLLHQVADRYAERWQQPDWRALVGAAFEQPRLRALSPGKSMHWFTLSRRAVPPICSDLPSTRPLGNGRFEVASADGRVREVEGAVAAVEVILDALPDHAVPLPWGL